MKRFYDTKLRCEVFEANENTLTNEDERVSFFFEELPQGKQVEFTEDGIPFLVDVIVISKETIELQAKINEARQYLASTDFKMTVDYYATLTAEEQAELTEKRAEAREYVRVNDVSNS